MKNRNGLLKKTIGIIMCFFMFCGALTGCDDVKNMVSGVAAAGVYPVTIGSVTINSRPSKVVVTSPSLADVVLALGYETQLLAGSEECTQQSLQDLRKINAEDAQAIIDLAPDMVLADPGSAIASTVQEAGIVVLAVEPATDREDYERLYAQVSSAFAGGESGYDAGVKAAQDVFLTLDTINRIVPKEKVTTACYLYDLESRAVTGDMFGTTIMTYSGVTNVFKSLEGGTFDYQTLKISNPNVIFCQPGMADEIKSDSRFAGFQAVKDNKVVEMDASLMQWQGRTVIEAAYEISAAAFPELLEENSMVVSDPTENINSQVSELLNSVLEETDNTKYETLQQGSQGDDVLKLQERLDELGYLDTEYDGHYGEYTAQCVTDFQKANELEETGVADADTQRKLYSQRAKAKGADSSSSASSESSTSSEE